MSIKANLVLAIALAMTIAGTAGACPVPKGAQHVPVLTYHEIVERHQDVKNGAMIPLQEFKQQMTWLKNNGFVTITCSDLAGFLHNGKRLSPKSVLVIFDDGYESVYTRVFPIMRSLKLRFAVAIIGSLIGTQTSDGLRYLTVDQMREMSASGYLEIQSHTFDCHERATGEPTDGLLRDFASFDALVKSWNLGPANSFIYPYGLVTSDLKRAIDLHGYLMAFTTARGAVTRASDPLQLPRIVVFPGTDTSVLQKALRRPD